MWVKVCLGCILVLTIVPSVVLQKCEVGNITKVEVKDGYISWNGSYEPSCLRGVQVCWFYPASVHISACSIADPDSTRLRMKNSYPCERIIADVTALGKDYNNSHDWPGNGKANPPAISGLNVTQNSNNSAILSWSSLKDFDCVTDVHLWICKNRTEDLESCLFEPIKPGTNTFEFYGAQICRYYYAVMRTFDKEYNQSSSLTTFPIYLDSASKVTKVKATEVTQNSAMITWWVSDAAQMCRKGQMRMCYKENDTSTTPDCWTWTMNQSDSSDSLKLVDLDDCRTYRATIGLTTNSSDSERTVTFTTPLHGEAIDAAVVNISDTAAVVTWAFDSERLDCQPDIMQVCHSAVKGSDLGSCHSLGSAASRTLIKNLATCTNYQVQLTLVTRVSPKPTRKLNLMTSTKDQPVLKSMNLTAVDTAVRVDWVLTGTSLDCVRHYNVSWYSSDDSRKTWRTFSVGTTSFTVFAVSRGETYYVQVTAVFVDGTTESLSQQVDIPARSGSSRSLGRFFLVLCMLSAFVI